MSRVLLSVFIATLVVCACDKADQVTDGGTAPSDDAATAAPGDASVDGAVPPTGGALFSGDPSAIALDALPDVLPTRVSRSDIQDGALLVRLVVVLRLSATVADFNAIATAAGATAIASSSPGSPLLTLVVPRQADGAALERLARSLDRLPGLLAVSAGPLRRGSGSRSASA